MNFKRILSYFSIIKYLKTLNQATLHNKPSRLKFEFYMKTIIFYFLFNIVKIKSKITIERKKYHFRLNKNQ